MAEKTAKSETTARKPVRDAAADRAVLSATQQNADMQRLLREAAWSRMFGKAAAPKNPFTR